MKNDDLKCFLRCILRAKNPKDVHPERVDKELKRRESTLNMEGIEYPVTMQEV